MGQWQVHTTASTCSMAKVAMVVALLASFQVSGASGKVIQQPAGGDGTVKMTSPSEQVEPKSMNSNASAASNIDAGNSTRVKPVVVAPDADLKDNKAMSNSDGAEIHQGQLADQDITEQSDAYQEVDELCKISKRQCEAEATTEEEEEEVDLCLPICSRCPTTPTTTKGTTTTPGTTPAPRPQGPPGELYRDEVQLDHQSLLSKLDELKAEMQLLARGAQMMQDEMAAMQQMQGFRQSPNNQMMQQGAAQPYQRFRAPFRQLQAMNRKYWGRVNRKADDYRSLSTDAGDAPTPQACMAIRV